MKTDQLYCYNKRDKTRKSELLEVLHCHKLSVGQRNEPESSDTRNKKEKKKNLKNKTNEERK